MNSSLEIRVAVLEEKNNNISDDLLELKEISKKTSFDLADLRQRVIQTNGTIPHMADSLKNISDTQSEMIRRMNKADIVANTAKVKLGILWVLTGAIVTAILGYILKVFFG